VAEALEPVDYQEGEVIFRQVPRPAGFRAPRRVPGTPGRPAFGVRGRTGRCVSAGPAVTCTAEGKQPGRPRQELPRAGSRARGGQRLLCLTELCASQALALRLPHAMAMAARPAAPQGERGERFYLIQEGAVSVVRTNSAGDRTAMASLGVGAYFGERALAKDEARRAAAPRGAALQAVAWRGVASAQRPAEPGR